MRVLREQAVGEIVEKKSKFIATVRPVESKEEAEAFIAQMKKQYWDARHNCSAYVVGEKSEVQHSSDDGEPSGTAGRPMLSVLTGWDVHNVAAVVTRYFGGVLLGTGGLIRAYQGALTAALENADIREQVPLLELDAVISYGDISRVENYVNQNENLRLEGCEYTEQVKMMLLAAPDYADQAVAALTQVTAGRIEIKKGRLRHEIL